MRTIYYKAVHLQAFDDLSDEIELQIMNGCTSLKHLRIADSSSLNYCHYDSIHDFMDSMIAVVEKNILNAAKNSPGKLYGLMMDESTDQSVHSTLMIYIRFVDGSTGEVRNHFLCVTALEGNTAADIFDAAVKVLSSKGLNPCSVVSLGTDGASVMTGDKFGVGRRFKDLNPSLIQNHCMSHRLALASQKAASEVPYLTKFIEVVNSLHNMFRDSAKMKRLLENSNVLVSGIQCQDTADESVVEKPKTVKPVFFTRWLSFHLAVVSLVSCLPGLFCCLTTAANDNSYSQKAKCVGLLKKMATYQFIATCYFLKDCLELLSYLCKSLQRDSLQYHEAEVKVSATVSSLQGLKTKHGAAFTSFEQQVPKDPPVEGNSFFLDQEITDNSQLRERFANVRDKFIDALLSHLDSWFPQKENQVVKHLSILNPQNLPEEIPSDYGKAELTALRKHFAGRRSTGQRSESSTVTGFGDLGASTVIPTPMETDESESTSEPLSAALDEEALSSEWSVVLNMMCQEQCKRLPLQEFYARYIHKDLQNLPNIGKLYVISLTNVMTSVPCERGFSAYNLTKTSIRNRLLVSTVNKSMMLRLNGPNLADFNFEEAFEHWVSSKDRRAYYQLLKHSKTPDAATAAQLSPS